MLESRICVSHGQHIQELLESAQAGLGRSQKRHSASKHPTQTAAVKDADVQTLSVTSTDACSSKRLQHIAVAHTSVSFHSNLHPQ